MGVKYINPKNIWRINSEVVTGNYYTAHFCQMGTTQPPELKSAPRNVAIIARLAVKKRLLSTLVVPRTSEEVTEYQAL